MSYISNIINNRRLTECKEALDAAYSTWLQKSRVKRIRGDSLDRSESTISLENNVKPKKLIDSNKKKIDKINKKNVIISLIKKKETLFIWKEATHKDITKYQNITNTQLGQLKLYINNISNSTELDQIWYKISKIILQNSIKYIPYKNLQLL
ncbi:5501_t:CDS:2 [Gigaspora margarita]|uniref:5501_t:CDS:1 n=1 Tax=Gigaspora margarita TaxID=4874 RepID=A0ABN7V2P8_GIGMA|nr:5501_t:CDS:2 [Gigaspora margarita]